MEAQQRAVSNPDATRRSRVVGATGGPPASCCIGIRLLHSSGSKKMEVKTQERWEPEQENGHAHYCRSSTREGWMIRLKCRVPLLTAEFHELESDPRLRKSGPKDSLCSFCYSSSLCSASYGKLHVLICC